jgi:hypothetical protein
MVMKHGTHKLMMQAFEHETAKVDRNLNLQKTIHWTYV